MVSFCQVTKGAFLKHWTEPDENKTKNAFILLRVNHETGAWHLSVS
jgi:hypothetical protein